MRVCAGLEGRLAGAATIGYAYGECVRCTVETTRRAKVLAGAAHTEERRIVLEGEPKHSAIYEIENPEVLLSKEWAAAVEAGRWPGEVRPHTSNRRHVLRKVTTTAP